MVGRRARAVRASRCTRSATARCWSAASAWSRRSQAADGSLHAHPPADIPGHRLPDFMLTWVALAVGLPVPHRPHRAADASACRRCTGCWSSSRSHDLRDGLIGGFEGSGSSSTGRNCIKAELQRRAEPDVPPGPAPCRCAVPRNRRRGSAARVRSEGEVAPASIERHFWDSEAKVWRDGFDARRRSTIEQISQHANALAILLDLKPRTPRPRRARAFCSSPRNRARRKCSPAPLLLCLHPRGHARDGPAGASRST